MNPNKATERADRSWAEPRIRVRNGLLVINMAVVQWFRALNMIG